MRKYLSKYWSVTLGVNLLAIFFGWVFFVAFSFLGWGPWGCGIMAVTIGLFFATRGAAFYRGLSRSDKVPLQPKEDLRFLQKLAGLYLTTTLAVAVGYAAVPYVFASDGGFVRFLKNQPGLGPHIEPKPSPVKLLNDLRKDSWKYPPESPGLLGSMRYLSALITGMIFWGRRSKTCSFQVDPHIRGRQLLTLDEATRLAKKNLPRKDPGLFFGGVFLPSEEALLHFAVVGVTGSGKTLTQRLLMQSLLPSVGKGLDHRALVYDPKRDMLSLLAGAGIKSVVILNPFDTRCAAWDLAADCTSPATAGQIATIFVPEENDHNRFFPDAARRLLSGVLTSLLTTHPGKWTLRDVVLAVRTEDRIRQFVERLPQTKHLIGFFNEQRQAAGILSTLETKLDPFAPIAACWHRASAKISLSDWIVGEAVLLLGNDESIRAALDAVNRIIFKRIIELVLSQLDSDKRRTYFFLDEVREAGKLDGLSRLLTQGRSKGASVILGLQDTDGLQEVYGKEIAQEILGQCCNKAILRLQNPSVARWAAEVFNEREYFEYQKSKTSGPGGASETTGEQIVKREVVLPSQFMNMPSTNRKNGLSGFYLTPALGAFTGVIPPGFLRRALAPPNPEVPNFIPRPVSDQYLEPWNKADLDRLGLVLPPDDLKEDEKRPLKIVPPVE